MKYRDLILTIGAVALAGLIYLLIGRPGMADAPMSQRQAELSAMNPADMTTAETLARLEALVRERPGDPQPHFFIGQVLVQQGRDDDAVRAFQSALRRDGDYTPAMIALADSFVRLGDGEIGPDASRIYFEAALRDPGDVRAAFLSGVSPWRNDNRAEAEQRWSSLLSRLPDASSERAQLTAMVTAFREAELEQEAE